MKWNLADIFDSLARYQPRALAQVEVARSDAGKEGRGCRRSRSFTWSQFEQRAKNLERYWVAQGLGRQGKVAQYLYNCPEYMESVYGCFKASLVPVNTNYRYVESELIYLWRNADVESVVFHGEFSERISGIREQLPMVSSWLWIDDGSGSCPSWAVGYEEIATGQQASGDGADGSVERDGDDLWLLYTGGTTGMPKGVMWRQDDLWRLINGRRLEPFELEGGIEGLEAQFDERLTNPIQLPACPLMHGTGFITALGALLGGGCVVTLAPRRFDPEFTLDVVESEAVQILAIVGDAFARPLCACLDRDPERWDISSLTVMTSSGVMWSQEVKAGLLRHHPELLLNDGLGSSEAIGMGKSESTGGDAAATAKFVLGDTTCILTEDGRRVTPGSGERGRIAVYGHIPVGYYKDEKKTRETFPTFDGVRYSIAGDWAMAEADGTITLLGRGSVCINTGGEKVFPEEVEEILKKHDSVVDAVCVGVPDPRFGQAITAVVEVHHRAEPPDESDLIALVKEHLAPYKAPKRVLFRDIGRAANGKADYNGLREWATEQLVAPEVRPDL